MRTKACQHSNRFISQTQTDCRLNSGMIKHSASRKSAIRTKAASGPTRMTRRNQFHKAPVTAAKTKAKPPAANKKADRKVEAPPIGIRPTSHESIRLNPLDLRDFNHTRHTRRQVP